MKKDIHPNYKPLKIKLPNKDNTFTIFETKSTHPAETYTVDILFSNHPAWNKGAHMGANQKATNVAKFNKKYQGLGLGASTASSQNNEEKTEN